MYPTSEGYKQSVKGAYPSYLTGTLTFKDGTTRDINDSVISVGSVSIEMQSVTQDVLEFGAAIIGQLGISLKTDKNESRYKYFGASIVIENNIELPDGTETIPLGVWTVAEAERDKTVLKLTAYDNMLKLDKPFNVSVTGTPFELMTVLTGDCELELAEDEDYYLSLPNGEQLLTVGQESGCSTYRQAVSVVAQMCGTFIQADRFGKITFKQFSATPIMSINASQRYGSTIADYKCTYVEVVASGLAGTFAFVSTVATEGMTFYMDDAPAWDSGVDNVLTGRVEKLMQYLDTLPYTPCELLIPSDPSIDCGDRIIIETENSSVETLVTSYTWKYRGQMILESVGKNPYLVSNSANNRHIIRNIQQNGSGAGKIIFYPFKNAKRFKATHDMETIASVVFAAKEETAIVFNATVRVDVTVDEVTNKSSLAIKNSDGTETTYEIPYNRNGYTDLYIGYFFNDVDLKVDLIQTVTTGHYIITLYYPIELVQKDSIHRFEVRMSADGGEVIVEPEMFYGTINGQGLLGKIPWDGTITISDEIPKEFDMRSDEIELVPLVDKALSINVADIAGGNFGQILPKVFSLNNSDITLVGFDYVVGIGDIITNYIVEVDNDTSIPYPKTIVSEEIDLTHHSIAGIDSMTVNGEGNPLFAVSFDEKITWYIWDGTNWIFTLDEFSGMTKDLLEAVTSDNWNLLSIETDSFYIRTVLLDDTSNVTEINVKFINHIN